MPELNEWDSFYVIVGSSAGALIGLQFVVLTLIAERPMPRAAEAGAAFATPNVLHFCAALILSATLRVPWKTVLPLAVLWGAGGVAGVVYVLGVAKRMRTQGAYRPVFEDWLFHFLLPLAGYGSLIAAALLAQSELVDSLFIIGAVALLLLLIGIHNSWDAVSYHVMVNILGAHKENEKQHQNQHH